MKFFFNELSLHGQFNSYSELKVSLENLWACKKVIEQFNYRLSCGRGIPERPALRQNSFRQALSNINDRDMIRELLVWLDKLGPFEELSHLNELSESGEYFELSEINLESTTLAEAAFQIGQNNRVAMVSLFPSNFEADLINITFIKIDCDEQLSIQNFFSASTLEAAIRQQTPLFNSWDEVLIYAQRTCPRLSFFNDAIIPLANEPFDSGIAGRILEILKILNELKRCFDSQGKITEEGFDLRKKYMQGESPLFTDESETNKKRFKKKLTFTNQAGLESFYPFHGKVRFGRQYRIHHSWPVYSDQPLYIAYIGPKITKN